MQINLGDKARDLVTGFEGICVARTQWLNGCIRCTIQPQGLDTGGKVMDTQTIDEPQLHLLQIAVVPVGNPDTGGPIPTPQRHAAPQR